MRLAAPLTALVAAATLGLTSCASNSHTGTGPTGSSGSTSASSASKVDAAAAALLPASIKKSRTLRVGTDASSPPSEYKDANNKIVGFDIDLFDAVAARLGVKASYINANFDNIIPGITGGKYDVGVSSFTDNKERQKTVDFVTYYQVGEQFVAGKSSGFNPSNACGKKVAVQSGTVELDDLKQRTSTCQKNGKPAITIQAFASQGDATTAVRLGKDNAMTADYPVSADVARQSGGSLVLVGAPNFNAAPYGLVIAKTSGLQKALQMAVQGIIDDGTYDAICKHWSLTSGEIKHAKINAAIS